jgi:hypothetical protein
MPDPKYVHIKISDIPEKFFTEYNLGGRDRKGWIYFEIWKGCYGLPQAGILVNDLICSHHLTEGFYEAVSTPGSGATNGVPSNSASSLTTLA